MSAGVRIVLGSGAAPDGIRASAWDARRDVCVGEVEARAAGDAEGGDAGGTAGAVAAAMTELLEQLGADAPRTVTIQLRPPLTQLRSLRGLPPVRSRDLVRLVREQRDRFFRPVDGDAIVAARWERRGEDPVARAALAERSVLEGLEAAAEEHGSRVTEIHAARDEDDGHALPLPTPRLVEAGRRRRLRTVVGCVAVAAAGWLLPAIVHIADLLRDDRALRVRLAELDRTVATIDSLERRVAAFAAVAEVVREQGPGAAWAAATLADVAERLPMSLHLHGAELVTDGVATLRAHSDGAAGVADSIELRWSGRARVQGDVNADEFTIVVERGP